MFNLNHDTFLAIVNLLEIINKTFKTNHMNGIAYTNHDLVTCSYSF